jgi:hypothetical protein
MSDHSEKSLDKNNLSPQHTSISEGGGGEYVDNIHSQNGRMSAFLNSSGETPPDPKTILQMQSVFGNQATIQLLRKDTPKTTTQPNKKSTAYPFSGLRMVQRESADHREPSTTAHLKSDVLPFQNTMITPTNLNGAKSPIQRDETFLEMAPDIIAKRIKKGTSKIKAQWDPDTAPAKVGKVLGKVTGMVFALPVAILMGIFRVPQEKAEAVIEAFIEGGGTVGEFIGKVFGTGAQILRQVVGGIAGVAGGIAGGALGLLTGLMGKKRRSPSLGDTTGAGMLGGAYLGDMLGKIAVDVVFSPVTKSYEFLKALVETPLKFNERRKKFGIIFAGLQSVVDIAKATASLAAALTLLFTVLAMFPFGQPLIAIIPVVGWIAFIAAAVQLVFAGLLRGRLATLKEPDNEEDQKRLALLKRQANIDIVTGLLGTILGGFVPATAGGAVASIGAAPSATATGAASAAQVGAAVGGEAIDISSGRLGDKAVQKKSASGSPPRIIQRTTDEDSSGTDDEDSMAVLNKILAQASEIKQGFTTHKEAATEKKDTLDTSLEAVEAGQQQIDENDQLKELSQTDSKVGEIESGMSQAEQNAESYKSSEDERKTSTDEAEINTTDARIDVVEEHADRDPETIDKSETAEVKGQIQQIQVQPKKEKWYSKPLKALKKLITKLFARLTNMKQKVARVMSKIKQTMTSMAMKALGLDKPITDLTENLEGAHSDIPEDKKTLTQEASTATEAEGSVDELIDKLKEVKKQQGDK